MHIPPPTPIRLGRTWTRLLEAHFAWMLAHNYSPLTVSTRRIHLRGLALWCMGQALRSPCLVTTPDLEQYQQHLFAHRTRYGRPLGFQTQRTALVAVQVFFKWLLQQEHILRNPALSLKLPQGERHLPDVLSIAEMEHLLEGAAEDIPGPIAVRDRTMLEILYSTGMRRLELCGLRVHDVNARAERVFVKQGKGKKDRMIPIGRRALQWIARYLEEARPQLLKGPDSAWLFLTQSGQPFSAARLTELVRDRFARVGMAGRGACHILRHSCATLMLENGADIRFIQQLLGHEQLTTTQLYTQVSIRELQKVHRKTHPASEERRGGRRGRSVGAGAHDECIADWHHLSERIPTLPRELLLEIQCRVAEALQETEPGTIEESKDTGGTILEAKDETMSSMSQNKLDERAD